MRALLPVEQVVAREREGEWERERVLTLFAGEASDDVVRGAIEAFVSTRLADAGIWPSARASDGVGAYRFVERTATEVRLVGRIWTIADQVEHHFWLDLERRDATLSWTLHFEVDPVRRSERQTRHLVDALARRDDVEWLNEIHGETPAPPPAPPPER